MTNEQVERLLKVLESIATSQNQLVRLELSKRLDGGIRIVGEIEEELIGQLTKRQVERVWGK